MMPILCIYFMSVNVYVCMLCMLCIYVRYVNVYVCILLLSIYVMSVYVGDIYRYGFRYVCCVCCVYMLCMCM